MRFLPIVSLLLIVALVLGACGPAVPTAVDETTESGQRFLLSLPRLTIDVDEQGRPNLGGVTLNELGSTFGVALPDFAINPFYVDWMKNTNVQHMELVHTADGMHIYVNGEAMPYLAWDGEALANAGEVAGLFNVPFAQLIGRLAPILERTGLNIVLRFPTQEGAAPVAMRDPSMVPMAPPEEDVTPAMVAKADIVFDENGVPSFAGLSAQDLLMAGIAVPGLAPETMAMIQQYGVDNMRIVTGPTGVRLYVNEKPLPYLRWDSASLEGASNLYAQMNPDSPYIELAKLFLPEMRNVDVDLMVDFAGQ